MSLSFQDPLGHALLQALEQAVFAERILGVHPVFHQFIEKTVNLTGCPFVSGLALPPCEQDIRYCQLHKTCYILDSRSRASRNVLPVQHVSVVNHASPHGVYTVDMQ